MKIELKSKSQNETTLVILSSSAKKTGPAKETTRLLNKDLQKRMNASLVEGEISGKSSEATIYRDFEFESHRHLVIVGLGDNFSSENFRSVSASILSAVKSLKSQTMAIDLTQLSKSDLEKAVTGLTEGLILSNYSFDELKSKPKNAEKTEMTFHLICQAATDKKIKSVLQEAMTVAETVNFSRRLGDMPGNLMTPAILAESAVEAAKGTGIKVTVWDRARIKKEKMGGLYGVGQGSHEEPRFIIMEYKGAAASKKPIVYVGKGLTFDTGGISIKPSAAMEEMKYDMCGGANVIGTILAIAKLKLKVNAVALIPASENMPSGNATKPGDVHTARNGKTFEINNTDAEGRLILSDALCYASELKPQFIVDAATLTGAIVVALGNTHTGYFTRNEKFKKQIESAATTTGEAVWNMPLNDFHVKDMKGTFADLSNTSSSKGAGSATAAAFLEQFVEEGIPWAHFDIAGTAWAVGNRLPYCPKKGASGAMVRTFVEIAKLYC